MNHMENFMLKFNVVLLNNCSSLVVVTCHQTIHNNESKMDFFNFSNAEHFMNGYYGINQNISFMISNKKGS